MALGENENMVMPVTPMGGYGNGGNCFGGDYWWIILLFLAFGGWGNGAWGGNGGGMNGLYPWLNNSNELTSGFRDQALTSGIGSIQNALTAGFGDVQNALCGGFAGVNAAIANAQYGTSQQLFQNQLSDIQAFNALQAALAQCCCENRQAIADLKYSLATEACNNRQAIADAKQTILDKMCADKIDAKNEKIAELQAQILRMQSAAETDLQTRTILAGQQNGINALEQYLAPVPRPAYVVQNPNCCPQQGCQYMM